jgi:tripeptide aminopeptidase
VQQLFAGLWRFVAERTAVRELPLWAEESRRWQGYSHPYRARTTASGAELDVRIRDFVPADLELRKAHVRASFGASGALVSDRDQYVNMGPRLAERRDLVEHALAAGRDIGVTVRELPIRGGTGVDPFLERGTAVANLGTGYFAPESEKELTSLALMARHVRWLVALLARLADVRE